MLKTSITLGLFDHININSLIYILVKIPMTQTHRTVQHAPGVVADRRSLVDGRFSCYNVDSPTVHHSQRRSPIGGSESEVQAFYVD